MRKYKQLIVGIVIGILISTVIGVSATILYQASQIGFTPADNNWNVNNLESALNDLYSRAGSASGISTATSWKFPAATEEQTFEVPVSGNYKLEVWGAQGGNYDNTYFGGYGGYSVGTVNIDINQTPILYINVGGAGKSDCVSKDCDGGYNGGGTGKSADGYNHVFGGGGATHIATRTGTLDQLSSYKGEYDAERGTSNSSVILIVAGGGGGCYYYTGGSGYSAAGGSAGGYNGSSGEPATNIQQVGGGGTQNGAGAAGYRGGAGLFGLGGTGSSGASGGGGGFYGGGASGHSGSGGGSGYIGSSLLTNKHMTCWDCTESNSEHIKTQRVADSTKKSQTPLADYVKIGNGHAKITYLGN